MAKRSYLVRKVMPVIQEGDTVYLWKSTKGKGTVKEVKYRRYSGKSEYLVEFDEPIVEDKKIFKVSEDDVSLEPKSE